MCIRDRINTISDRGEEYYVYLQAERDERSDITDLANKYVRSDRTGELVPLSTLVLSLIHISEPTRPY